MVVPCLRCLIGMLFSTMIGHKYGARRLRWSESDSGFLQVHYFRYLFVPPAPLHSRGKGSSNEDVPNNMCNVGNAPHGCG
jgi:hypothetical protein